MTPVLCASPGAKSWKRPQMMITAKMRSCTIGFPGTGASSLRTAFLLQVQHQRTDKPDRAEPQQHIGQELDRGGRRFATAAEVEQPEHDGDAAHHHTPHRG